jgi:hypothetical protein
MPLIIFFWLEYNTAKLLAEMRSIIKNSYYVYRGVFLQSAESIFVFKYLRKYESIFETALAHESVDPGELFDENITR